MTENEKKYRRAIKYERERRMQLEQQLIDINQLYEQVQQAYIMAFHAPLEKPENQQRHLMKLSNLLYGV